MYSAKLNQTSRKPKIQSTGCENYFSQPVDQLFPGKRTIKVRIVLKSYVPSQDSLENLSMGLEPIHFSRFDLFITRLAFGSPSNEKILTWKVKRLLAHWKFFKAVPGMKNTNPIEIVNNKQIYDYSFFHQFRSHFAQNDGTKMIYRTFT